MNYAQQIKHPLWQKKRLEVLMLNDFTCMGAIEHICGEVAWFGNEPAVEFLAKFAEFMDGKVDLAKFEQCRNDYNARMVA